MVLEGTIVVSRQWVHWAGGSLVVEEDHLLGVFQLEEGGLGGGFPGGGAGGVYVGVVPKLLELAS